MGEKDVKQEERKYRKKIKLLEKNSLLSNIDRIVNNALILNLCLSYLSLTDQFILFMLLISSSITTYTNIRLILGIITCYNTYILSVASGIVFNKIYNNIKLKKFSSKQEIELLEEELLSKINLDKLILRNRIEKIKNECDNILISNKIDTKLDFDTDKLKELYSELDYLIIKKNLIQNYLESDATKKFDKTNKKTRLFNSFIFAPFCVFFLTLIGAIPFFNSIFIGPLLVIVIDIINDIFIFPKIAKNTHDNLEYATMSVQTKFGEFYIPKDYDLLISEMNDNYNKITSKINEISIYYYNAYEIKIMNSTNPKNNTQTIAPVDRTFETASSVKSRVLKKDESS